MKAIKLIILFLAVSSVLFAGDDFMSHWKAYHYGIFMSILFLFVLIPLWGILSLLFDGKVDGFFKSLVVIDLLVLVISWFSLLIANHIEAQNYKPRHTFQNPYEYGIYKNNVVVFEEKNSSIIDMHLKDSWYVGNHKNLSYLTQQGLLVCDIRDEYGYRYIDVSVLKPLMAECTDDSVNLLISDKNISSFDLNRTKFKARSGYIPMHLNISKDYKKSSIRNVWTSYKTFATDHIDINSTKDIKDVRYYPFLPVMDKNNNEIILYRNGYPIHKFRLDRTPKLVIYDRHKDIFYIVYKDDDFKIYELTNTLSKSYKLAQSRVKTIINEAYQPWWKSPKPPYDGISSEDMDKLVEYFDKVHMDLDYKVKHTKDSNISYQVEVTSQAKPMMSLVFNLDTNKTYTKINNISYNTRYPQKELFQVLAKELVETKTDFDILQWLIKYESLLANIKYKYVLNNRDIKDDRKTKLASKMDQRMRNYLWSEVAKISSIDKKKMVRIFKRRYTCISRYLEGLRKRDLNSRHPLSHENVMKTLHELFYTLNYKCKHIVSHPNKNYKKLFEEIDKKLPFNKIDYELNRILRQQHINSVRLKKVKSKKKKHYKKHKKRYLSLAESQEIERKRLQRFKHLSGSLKERYEKALKQDTHPIFATIKYHQHKKFLELLASLNNLEIKDSYGYTPLFVALSQNNQFAVEQLIKKGAKVNTLGPNHIYTPLSHIVSDNNIELVKLLISLGADVNYQSHGSETVLTVASKGCRNFNVVKYLLQVGANPYLQDKYGFDTITRLKLYCQDKDDCKKMMKLIKENNLYKNIHHK